MCPPVAETPSVFSLVVTFLDAEHGLASEVGLQRQEELGTNLRDFCDLTEEGAVETAATVSVWHLIPANSKKG